MYSRSEDGDEDSLGSRVASDPRPAAVWLAGLLAFVAVEFGALASFVMAIPWDGAVGGVVELLRGFDSSVTSALADGLIALATPVASIGDALAGLPTLLNREVIPNQGYELPDAGWQGTFLGLSPAAAWAIRVTAIYAYAFGLVWWFWRGYLVFREHYRHAEWTPTDDSIERFRTHRWGQFGFVVVLVFVVLAAFAPALGPSTIEDNIEKPYSATVKYYDEDAGTVEEIFVGDANLGAASLGRKKNTGIGEYDQYGRFHPFGTLTEGKDLFTFMAAGARVSMFIGLLATGISSVIALAVALSSAYYRGKVDLMAVFVSDSVSAMPGLLALIMLSVVLRNTWIASIYSGGLLLALIFGGLGWTGLWRSIRGPALQTAESEWIDAAISFGERPRTIARKHIAPYVIGYLLVYASMSIGGVMIGTAGLSFLGIGINPPTPEWGRAVSMGQEYVTSPSWHISILPGLAVTIVVIGFNALGDGIRDAIDPQSQNASDEAAIAVGDAA